MINVSVQFIISKQDNEEVYFPSVVVSYQLTKSSLKKYIFQESFRSLAKTMTIYFYATEEKSSSCDRYRLE